MTSRVLGAPLPVAQRLAGVFKIKGFYLAHNESEGRVRMETWTLAPSQPKLARGQVSYNLKICSKK